MVHTFEEVRQAYADFLRRYMMEALPDCDPVRGITFALARTAIRSCKTWEDIDAAIASHQKLMDADLDGVLCPAEAHEIGVWLKQFERNALAGSATPHFPRYGCCASFDAEDT